MPVLKDIRKIKEIKLPKSEITIKIRDGLLAGDVEEMQNQTDAAKQGIMIIARLITEWDATDEKGTALAINYANIKLLPIEDMQEIQNNLGFVQDFLAQAADRENSANS